MSEVLHTQTLEPLTQIQTRKTVH